MPLVSVIIPAFNSSGTLADCLQSVRASLYQDYELIVVDDGSQDETAEQAEKWADRVLRFGENCGRSHARNEGVKAARGRILVFIDADILIPSDGLEKIVDYFARYPHVDAVTGLLAKDHPHAGYFSQYKNLYMHYTFQRLAPRVTFLYGSICAVRQEAFQPFDTRLDFGEDTELGQRLTAGGRHIALLKDLQVVHLKSYGLRSLIRNDFWVPFFWVRVFLQHGGWKQLFSRERRFAHSSHGQILSVILSGVVFLSIFLTSVTAAAWPLLFIPTLIWFLLNRDYLRFLGSQKGRGFAFWGGFYTLFDQWVMLSGISAGFMAVLGVGLSKTGGQKVNGTN